LDRIQLELRGRKLSGVTNENVSDWNKKLNSINFENWSANHKTASNSEKFIYRYAYPWDVFGKLNLKFLINEGHQNVVTRLNKYVVSYIEHRVSDQNSNKNQTIIGLDFLNKEGFQSNALIRGKYKIISDTRGKFITIFKVGEELTQRISEKFIGGDFSNLEPIANGNGWVNIHLARFLLYQVLSQFHVNLTLFQIANTSERKERRIDFQASKFHWVFVVKSSMEAHYLGIEIANRVEVCEIVYLTKNISKHHQCNDPSVKIFSLLEYIGKFYKDTDVMFNQAQVLCNLHGSAGLGLPQKGPKRLLDDILEGKLETEHIYDGHLTAAFSALSIFPKNEEELCYMAAGANLINAALNKKKKLYRGSQEILKEAYSFKSVLAERIGYFIELNPRATTINISDEDNGLVLIDAMELQFSFHAIKGKLEEKQKLGKKQWIGIRLQNHAVTALDVLVPT
jgi:hypothetical protein